MTVAKPADKQADQIKADYVRPDTIPFPRENTYTPEKAELGRTLYFDPRLSRTSSQSCASCHNPGFGWGDGLGKGIGDKMSQLGRRSPTILNAAWGAIFMWDGRAASLEDQALGPVESPAEMNLPAKELVARLSATSAYPALFEKAFPGEGITAQTIAKSIATYERTVVSPRTPFDAWIDGQADAISASAQRGFTLFNTKAACNLCHSGWNLTDDSFHDIGMSDADTGRAKFIPASIKMSHAFKTPGLRGISHRGPYMHDGSMPTLAAVVDHYNSGGISRPSRSDLIRPLELNDQEKADLVAFLQTLSGTTLAAASPMLPR